LLHSKVIMPSSREWLYIGSHNFTKRAWGSIGKVSTDPTNFELGLWFPPGAVPKDFESPFKMPLQPYSKTDEAGGIVRYLKPGGT